MNQAIHRVRLLLMTVVLSLHAFAAEPLSAADAPVSQPSASTQPPTIEQITQTLSRVRDRLDAATGSRIIDSKTGEPITDLSKPTENARLDSGPEKKFPAYSYPMGVIYTGMIYAGDVTDDPKYAAFVNKRFQFFAGALPQLEAWPKDQMRYNPLRNMLAPGNLDACGSMGASIARAKCMQIGPNLDSVIMRFADYVSHKQQRLQDGTFARPHPFRQSLWLDDAYMSVPLLAQLGKLTGEQKYFDDAATQIKGFHKHLFDPGAGLLMHGRDMDSSDPPKFFWGRANGWFMLATVELLDLLPQDHPDRQAVMDILKDHANGIAAAQSTSGLWHQLLDRRDSYLETSCSAMFTYALAKAVNRGWLNGSTYAPVAIAGWNGVARKIDDAGHVTGTCIGTNLADNDTYYYERTATDDIHGYGPVLLAGAEMLKLLKSHERVAWFNEARFGLFLHWGIYSVPAGEWEGKSNYAEWFQLETKMPATEYAQFASQFNPLKFDAKGWAKTAKDAGMRYVVITAKHHDGFCMFDSRLTDYDVVDTTPYGKDALKELADAVRAVGMKFCFYYSVPDWHHPDFPARYSQRATTTEPGFHGQPNPDADPEKYVEYVKGQVRELLKNYGPIGIMWFDAGGDFGKDNDLRIKVMHAQEIVDLIHKLQPECLINNRLGLPGDYDTPEQKIPGGKSGTPFEVCMTLNRHWGYNKADQDWKPPKTVIHNLVDIASKGGNYLLNVGPTAQGEFPQAAVDILGQVGAWMRVNGESIYGTRASPLDITPQWGRVTQKGQTLYLHVFDWPVSGELNLPHLPGSVKRAYLLADASKRALDISDTGAVKVPKDVPDSIDSVVVVEIER